MDPHTTSTKTRACGDCHENPKGIGLGYGSISLKKDGNWTFEPASSLDMKVFGQDRRLDAFVDKQGRPLVHTSRKDLRPFDKKELDRIVKVGFCLPCHKDMDDPVMKDWTQTRTPKPCKAFLDLIPLAQ